MCRRSPVIQSHLWLKIPNRFGQDRQTEAEQSRLEEDRWQNRCHPLDVSQLFFFFFATGLLILIRDFIQRTSDTGTTALFKYLGELILKRNINFFFGCTTYCSNIWHVHSDGKYIGEKFAE